MYVTSPRMRGPGLLSPMSQHTARLAAWHPRLVSRPRQITHRYQSSGDEGSFRRTGAPEDTTHRKSALQRSRSPAAVIHREGHPPDHQSIPCAHLRRMRATTERKRNNRDGTLLAQLHHQHNPGPGIESEKKSEKSNTGRGGLQPEIPSDPGLCPSA